MATILCKTVSPGFCPSQISNLHVSVSHHRVLWFSGDVGPDTFSEFRALKVASGVFLGKRRHYSVASRTGVSQEGRGYSVSMALATDVALTVQAKILAGLFIHRIPCLLR